MDSVAASLIDRTTTPLPRWGGLEDRMGLMLRSCCSDDFRLMISLVHFATGPR